MHVCVLDVIKLARGICVNDRWATHVNQENDEIDGGAHRGNQTSLYSHYMAKNIEKLAVKRQSSTYVE